MALRNSTFKHLLPGVSGELTLLRATALLRCVGISLETDNRPTEIEYYQAQPAFVPTFSRSAVQNT